MSTSSPHKTAIQQWTLSHPVALPPDDGLFLTKTTFFHYGYRRRDDLLRLHKMGVSVSAWDPAFFSDEERTPADIVNIRYVVNVIEAPEARAVALRASWKPAQRVLIVPAKRAWETRTVASDFQRDGTVTRKRTFQEFVAQDELYLLSSDFDRVGHPALAEVFVSTLLELRLHHWDSRPSDDVPCRAQSSELTAQAVSNANHKAYCSVW